MEGAPNLHSPRHWKLLALFLGTWGRDVDWQCLDRHWGNSCAAVKVWQRLKSWLPYRRRLVAQQKIDSLLRNRCLPLTRGTTTQVPRQSLLRPVRLAISQTVHRRADWDESLKSWVLSKTSDCLGRSPKFADAQNCSQKSRQASLDEFDDASQEEIAAAQIGNGSKRIEHNGCCQSARPHLRTSSPSTRPCSPCSSSATART